ncbi:hypothetical protein HK407_12g18680 [Ordospora pajunii]|uniref:uncharacterized protein n=1 Tax=Ordospora pajunii TaxID=3039483 RepID=UPI0029528246|nr:uncharacterized protein HK407_12g18680 [Ordospora pajunii]KAH9410736.1 hypothetical protein HK407_12g18680 [Ordospora pajunii]
MLEFIKHLHTLLIALLVVVIVIAIVRTLPKMFGKTNKNDNQTIKRRERKAFDKPESRLRSKNK